MGVSVRYGTDSSLRCRGGQSTSAVAIRDAVPLQPWSITSPCLALRCQQLWRAEPMPTKAAANSLFISEPGGLYFIVSMDGWLWAEAKPKQNLGGIKPIAP